MATTKDYLQFILEQLSEVPNLTHRQMMGEYILYVDGKIAAYLCDDRLLVKPVPSALRRLPHAVHEPPYEGAKAMAVVEEVDDKAFLTALFKAMAPELPTPMKRKRTS